MPVKKALAVLVPATLVAAAAWGAAAPAAEATKRRPGSSKTPAVQPSPSGTPTAAPSAAGTPTAAPSPAGTPTAAPSPAGTPTTAPSAAGTPAAPAGPTVHVADYGTSTAAVQNAMNATPSGGTLVFPSGVVYSVTQPLNLPSGVTVQGNQSVLRTPNGSTTASSDDALLNTKGGDRVSGLVFDGNIQNQGGVWTQHRHAIRVLGGSSVNVSGNAFRNLIGDGVYVGGGASGIDIGNNTFDGNHTNRNGVSIVSGTNVNVHDNVFNSMSRPDMPGAVDLEPNAGVGDSLSNIKVYGNTVNDPAKYGLLLWNSVGVSVSGVAFHDNTVNGGANSMGSGAGIMVGSGAADIYHNSIKNIPGNGVELDDRASATVTDNLIDGALEGLNNWASCLTQSGNTFQNIGDKTISTYQPTC